MRTPRWVAAAVGGTLIALFTAACTSHPAVNRGTSTADPSPPPSTAPATPPATRTPAIDGVLYYIDYRHRDALFRSTPDGPVSVLPNGRNANVSPDGRHIANVVDVDLVVTDQNGGHARTLMHGVVGDGFEPAWSPDGSRLLVAKPGSPGWVGTPGVVDVATGRFTPLAHDPHGIHYVWSADGRHIGYATGTCQLGLADPDGGNAHLVPVLGDMDKKVNPELRRSCDPFSISPDGTRMAVALRTGDMTDGDIGRHLVANAVIDTRTGASISLPVTGTVNAVLFRPDGSMLVRSSTGLVLVSPGGTVLARADDPAGTKDMSLLAYVPA
jgi:TolB protein